MWHVGQQVLVVDEHFKVLPPAEASCASPPPTLRHAKLQNDGLEAHDFLEAPECRTQEESQPLDSSLEWQKTVEQFDLTGVALDPFYVRLLRNEVPVWTWQEKIRDYPEEYGVFQMDDVSSAADSEEGGRYSPAGSENSTEEDEDLNEDEGRDEDEDEDQPLTVHPDVVREMTEELVEKLWESYDLKVPAALVFDRLMNNFMKYLDIKVTPKFLGGRVFTDYDDAIFHIVREAHRSIKKYGWMSSVCCADDDTVIYSIAASISAAFKNYCLRGESSSTAASSPSSSDTEKVNTSASEEVKEETEDLEETHQEIPARAEPEKSADTGSKEEKKSYKILSRISKFLRRVFCCGCIPHEESV
ncbi:uncharacterized protein [Hoplias malabaricus]|uniref:uncharacterized protein n=1 Tax=Hoplias malabaricus TaxID=27720 RepID=UPI0034622DEC